MAKACCAFLLLTVVAQVGLGRAELADTAIPTNAAEAVDVPVDVPAAVSGPEALDHTVTEPSQLVAPAHPGLPAATHLAEEPLLEQQEQQLAEDTISPALGLLPGGLTRQSLTTAQSAALSQHNYWRERHNTAALAWDSTLASGASTWANKCNYRYDTSLSTTGENVWTSLVAPTQTNAAVLAMYIAVDAWYNQEPYYPFFLYNDTRRFAQVVWAAATKVGCASKKCGTSGGQDLYWVVCRYNKRAINYNQNGNNANIKPRNTILAAELLRAIATSRTANSGPPSEVSINFAKCLKSSNWLCKFCIDPNGYLGIYNGEVEKDFSITLLRYPTLTNGVVKPFRLGLQNTDGNLVERDANNVPMWATYAYGTVGKAQLRDDCNFVVLSDRGAVLWESKTSIGVGKK